METAIRRVGLIGEGDTAERVAGLLAATGVRVAAAKNAAGLADADLIIELLEGDRQERAKVLGEAAAGVNPGAVLATSGPGVTEIAASIPGPGRVIGLHFTFNPFEDKCLVQLVTGLETTAETLTACRELVEKAGAVAVTVKDLPGLTMDRILASVINEAAEMYDTGIAGIEDIDRVTRLCLNWPMGPFQFADALGIDHVVATLEAIAADEPRYAPCRLLRQMSAAGRLGKKSGQGFYSYPR